MTTFAPRLKFPAICFIILGVTLFIGGLGTLGGAVLLFRHFPPGTPIYLPPILALNGLGSLILTILCAMSVWKLLKQKAKANRFARVACFIAAAFTLWTLLFDGYLGWSTGGVAEVIIWGVLEALIAGSILKASKPTPS